MAVTAQPTIEDLFARLERERLDADRRYNEALTALDAAVQAAPPPLSAPPAPDLSRLPDVNQSWDLLPDGAPAFDRSLKGRLGRLVWRLVGPPLERQRQFNSAVADHLNRTAASQAQAAATLADLVVASREQLHGLVRFESLLVQYLQSITAYVDSKDRSLGGPELRERLALVEQRLLAWKRDADARSGAAGAATPSPSRSSAPAASPAAAGTAQPHPARGTAGGERDADGVIDPITYLAFEDQFRGSTGEIRRRVQDYVPMFAGASNVLDVGCGRGELLEALRDAGIRARGVDVSPAMVEVCRARGLDVAQGDAVGYLAGLADGQLGGLVAIQVVEHLRVGQLTRFLEAAYHAMAPGAPLVLETINPNCWMAFFETYIRDPTHEHPLHPDTLRHLVRASGFSSVDVQYRAPVGESDRLAHIVRGVQPSDPVMAEVIGAINDHATKLNGRLFSSMDYAVVARR